MTDPIEKHKNKCFIIAPIGEEGSDIRIRSDKILKYIIKPVCNKLKYITFRADEIDEPGLISKNR